MRRPFSRPTTPWKRRGHRGVYFGHSGDVDAYFELPLHPLYWEDTAERVDKSLELRSLLAELGEQSLDLGGGVEQLVLKREAHIFSIVYDVAVPLPDTPTEAHRTFLDQVLPSTAPTKSVLIGVRLRSDSERSLEGGVFGAAKGVGKQLRDKVAGSASDKFTHYAADYKVIRDLMSRYGAEPPSDTALRQLESFFNGGMGPDVPIRAYTDRLSVRDGDDWQIAAVSEFHTPEQEAVNAQWIQAAMDHQDPAVVISIRTAFLPSSTVVGKLRQSQRRWNAAAEEDAKTGDIERREIQEGANFAQRLEDIVRHSQTAWLSSTSILFAKRYEPADDMFSDYTDTLSKTYGIEVEPLFHRQLDALREMQPCGSAGNANPFPQVINPETIAFSGLNSYTNIGDPGYVFVGRGNPDNTLTWIDPGRAPKMDQPPAMGIFGDPGSGKTFLAQIIALQSAMAGVQTIMINPKGFSSLKRLLTWLESRGVPVRLVSLQETTGESGAFDPFSFAPPEMAAEILSRHILTVLGYRAQGGLSPEEELTLSQGLVAGARAGARCGREALAHVDDPVVRRKVEQQVEASTLFRLGFAETPRDSWDSGVRGLTLIEFDRDLPLPNPGQPAEDRDQLISLAAMRLVTRASMETLMAAKGGVLVVDEAHHFLGSTEGRAALQRMGREGRSLGMLPIFCTQRVSDLLDAEMESYLSRVVCMQLADPVQAAAALRICLLEATQERIAYLAQCGPRKPSKGKPGRPARGFMRDVEKRHSVITVGPFPSEVLSTLSTTPDDEPDPQADPYAEAA